MRWIPLYLALVCVGSIVGCSNAKQDGLASNSFSDEPLTEGAEVDERFSEESNAKAKTLHSLISSEIEISRKHSWAGSYFKGDGLGENVSIILAPGNGYLFEWHGCLGLHDRNFGKVEQQGERIRLSFTFSNTCQGFRGIAEEFLPIKWGDRIYLIPGDDIVGFCNEVNSGEEPRTTIHGSYLLRVGDEIRTVDGRPEVPVGFLPYLLEQPIETTIASVGKTTLRPSVCEWNFKDTEVTLDAGTNKGILPGMELYVIEPYGLVELMKISTSDQSGSTGVFTQTDDNAPPEIKAGWRLSTRPSWRQ